MSEDFKKELEKTTEETVDQSGSADETNQDSQVSEDSKTQETESKEDFYKEELERYKSRLNKAEHTIVKLKKSKEPVAEADEEDVDEEEVVSKIDKLVQEKVNAALAKTQEKEQDALIARLSESPEHAELIRYHLENTIRPTGDVTEDVENALLHADKKRIFNQLETYKDVLVSKQTADGAQSGGFKKKIAPKPTSKYSATEIEFLKKYGAKFDE